MIRALIDRFKPKASTQKGLGTFFGVYLPGILAVFGVIIYLRLGWIVGAVGFPLTFAIITLAFLVVSLTALSIAAVASNMRIGSGGTYYIVSRSFGLELGSSIGNALYVAQTLNIAFCTVGFAESLHSVLPIFPIQAIGLVTLVVLASLVYVSSQAALKAQFVIFLLVGVSLVTLFVSQYVPMEAEPIQIEVSKFSFWPIFAIFFPAATGIEAGIAMSGDLKNPKRGLSWGVFSVVFTAYVVYVAIAYFLSDQVPRHVLLNDPMILLKMARIRAFILLGIWAATLSSAIGGLMAAPRMLQAIAKDGVLPKFLAKGFGKMNEPRVASIATFILALFAVYFGSIDLIAPYLTMFALIAYGMLNLGAGIESFFNNPSWRPSIRIHSSIPLIGAGLCVVIMLMIDPGVSMISISAITIMYVLSNGKITDAIGMISAMPSCNTAPGLQSTS